MSEPTTRERYDAFLRGERLDDVLLYLHDESVGSVDDLLEVGIEVADGVVLVVPGEEGRSAFQRATGLDAMAFASAAMGTDGDLDADCTGGRCPDAGPGDDPGAHYPTFVFAFAEEQNDDVGGIYAEGDVLHAYAACDCGSTYADKWVV